MVNSESKFLTILKEIEPIFEVMGFMRTSTAKKWPVAYQEYTDGDCNVVFLFGPSDWHIEMIIYTSRGKYSFGELLKIDEVVEWVNNNRYQPPHPRSLRDELLWLFELLKFSLPRIK